MQNTSGRLLLFMPLISFYIPMTSENQTFSDAFKGYRKRPVVYDICIGLRTSQLYLDNVWSNPFEYHPVFSIEAYSRCLKEKLLRIFFGKLFVKFLRSFCKIEGFKTEAFQKAAIFPWCFSGSFSRTTISQKKEAATGGVLLKKVSLKTCDFTKKRLQHRYFPAKFALNASFYFL